MRLTNLLGRRVAVLVIFLLLLANVAQGAAFIVPQGGTGRSTFTSNAIIKGNGTGALAPSGVSIDSSNNVTGAANLQVGNDAFAVGPTASAAKYLTDGTADDVQINAALTACAADAKCKTVRLLPGTFTIADVIQL